MTNIWYDTEFIEDGRTIDLISIGMVREDGEKLYRINGDPAAITNAVNHQWLRENVVPHLPVTVVPATAGWAAAGEYDWKWADHPDIEFVEPRWLIAAAVAQFITSVPDPQLRAWYAAYDHVALMQLWGPMKSKPDGVPMWTFDLKQEAERLGNPRVPEQVEGEDHHALLDAEHDHVIDLFLQQREREIWDQWAR